MGLGPLAELRPAFLLRDVPQQQIPRALLLVMSLTNVVAALVWARGRLREHGLFFAAIGLWTLTTAMLVLPDLPFTRRGYALVLAPLWICFHWALLRLCWQFSGSTWHWFPRVLNLATLVLLAMGCAIAMAPEYDTATVLLLLPLNLLRLLTTVMLLHWALRDRSWRAWALAGSELIWFAGTLQVMAVGMLWIPPDPFMIMPACSAPLFFVLLAIFAQRLVQSREQTARERQAAIGAERERLLQDMHDGMGSQLSTALRLARRPEIDRGMVVQAIEEAMADLRLIIDAFDGTSDDLPYLLGNLRYRLEPRLQALGLRMLWQVDALPGAEAIGSRPALAVLRVVQEAINNALRHAGATTISLRAAAAREGIELTIGDDGCGFDADAARHAGRGLAGMQQRAERIGGRLQVRRRSSGGTEVSLWLPTGAGGAAARAAGLGA